MTTGYLIFVNGEPKYFLQMVTPKKEIYAHIGAILFIQRIRLFSFLAGIAAATAVLIVLLAKWNVILYVN